MSLHPRRVGTRLATPLLVMAALSALVLTGCSSDDSGSSDSRSSTSTAGGSTDGLAAPDAAPDAASAAKDASPDRVAADYDRRVIRTGTVELSAADVGKAAFEVQRLVDRHHGQVAQEKTTTDRRGEAEYTRMVLRVPEADFTTVVGELKQVARLVAADTDEEDVTTKVIDLQTRIRVQKQSIARITTLFERAEAIRDVMAIESELATRQADLDSLEQQAAYLEGQTTLSTITVSIDRTPQAPTTKHEKEAGGFVAGLSAGWGALTTVASGLATVVGALLPWAVVAALLAPVGVLLSRLVRRRLSAGAQRG